MTLKCVHLIVCFSLAITIPSAKYIPNIIFIIIVSAKVAAGILSGNYFTLLHWQCSTAVAVDCTI